MADNIPSTQPPVPVEKDDLDLVLAQVQEQAQAQTQSPSSTVPGTANDIPSSPVTIDTHSPRPDLNNTSSPSVPAPSSSFYDSLEIETELSPKVGQESSSPILKRLSSSSSPVSPIDKPSITSTSPLNTSKFGSKKVRAGGSNIARKIELLAAGKNENGSDLHTTTSSSFVSNPSSSGQTTPDPSDYPDSFFEDLLRSEQTTISRSFSTMPKPTPRKTTPTTSSSMPLQTSKFGGKGSDTNGTTNGDDTLVLSGDLEEDLKRLQTELTKTKEVKAKAEADAKAQRVTVMSLKTEVQLVRNVLKRRETELGDVKGKKKICRVSECYSHITPRNHLTYSKRKKKQTCLVLTRVICRNFAANSSCRSASSVKVKAKWRPGCAHWSVSGKAFTVSLFMMNT